MLFNTPLFQHPLLLSSLRLLSAISVVSALALACSFPQNALAAQSYKPEALIQARQQLTSYLTSTQRIALIDADKLIEEGFSDVRSGEFMLSTKPGRLDPNKNITAIHARGKKLVDEGNNKIRTGRKTIIDLLTIAQQKLDHEIAMRGIFYSTEIEEKTYEEALALSTAYILQSCWADGYEHILFDTVIETNHAGSRTSDSVWRNAAYDAFIEVDGKRFSVSLPVNMRLSSSGGPIRLTFDNAETFKDKKVALIGIELITPEGADHTLLATQAMDLQTYQIVAHSIFRLPNENIENETSGPKIKAIELTDEPKTLEKLAALNTPYVFKIDHQNISDPAAGLVAGHYLKQILLRQTPLKIVDSAYITRAYTKGNTEISSANSAHTALLRITPVAQPSKDPSIDPLADPLASQSSASQTGTGNATAPQATTTSTAAPQPVMQGSASPLTDPLGGPNSMGLGNTYQISAQAIGSQHEAIIGQLQIK